MVVRVAVDDVLGIGVEFCELCLEVWGGDVDVYGVFEVAFGELCGCVDIDDDGVGVQCNWLDWCACCCDERDEQGRHDEECAMHVGDMGCYVAYAVCFWQWFCSGMLLSVVLMCCLYLA